MKENKLLEFLFAGNYNTFLFSGNTEFTDDKKSIKYTFTIFPVLCRLVERLPSKW